MVLKISQVPWEGEQVASENKITLHAIHAAPGGTSPSFLPESVVTIFTWVLAREIESLKKKICLDYPFLLAWDLSQLCLFLAI